MSAIKTFKIDQKYLKLLTSNEKKILPILVEAAKKVDKIFLLQENCDYPGANFYPTDISKEKIEAEAKKDPKILSPFTVVEKENSCLIAIDYHLKYQKLIKPVTNLLNQAARTCANKSFKRYLEALSSALTNGLYHQADIEWLAVKNSNIDIIIGPYERYLDKLFFIKRAYQATVGIIDKSKTEKARLTRDIIYTTVGPKPHRIIPPSIVDVRVEYGVLYSGFLGRILFSQQHLPSDTDTTERYGSRIVGYLSMIDYKFNKLLFPIFNAVFEKRFKQRYTKDLLRKGNYYYVLLHAFTQQLHRYKGSRERLKEFFPVYDEANSVVSGVQHAKHLVLKGVINQKELEAIMIAHICWIISEWVIAKSTNIREDYLKGDALTFNFLTRQGALQVQEGISWPNFARMFFEMENLATIFTRFLSDGSYREAREFLTKYLSYEAFQTFNQRLSHIKFL